MEGYDSLTLPQMRKSKTANASKDLSVYLTLKYRICVLPKDSIFFSLSLSLSCYIYLFVMRYVQVLCVGAQNLHEG